MSSKTAAKAKGQDIENGQDGSYYYELLNGLCIAYRRKGDFAVLERYRAEFRSFRCSALEEEELIKNLTFFIRNIRSSEMNEAKKNALRDFLWLMPSDEAGRLLAKMPLQVHKLIMLFGLRDMRDLVACFSSDRLAAFLEVIPEEDHRMLYGVGG